MRAVIDKGHRAPFCCGDRSAASIRQSRSGRNKRQPSRSNRLECRFNAFVVTRAIAVLVVA
jgi:hypothetical protein